MNESVGLGRVAGVRVGVHWSLLPIFLLIAWSLATTLLPTAAPGYAGWGYWAFALFTAAAFYAGLLAHELAHALAARRHQINVRSIVLWLLGGVAQLEREMPNPRAELEMAAAGPAASFAVAAAAACLAWVLEQLGTSSLMVASVGWLAGINLLLGAFNLLPAFPLDGGRILRALLWRHWRDQQRATSIAARVGKASGFALIAIGILALLSGGGALSGVWLAVIGWFVVVAADQQRGSRQQPRQVGEPTAADAISGQLVTVPSSATVAEAIERYVLATRFQALPVIEPGGRLVGLATVRRIAELPRERWAAAPIAAAAASRSEIVECSRYESLADVAARLERSPDRRAVVLDGERPVGILTPADVARALDGGEPASGSSSGSRASRLPAWRPAHQPRPRSSAR